jgi:hypothetical protein
MDGIRFDDLSRMLGAAPWHRRRLIWLLAGAALAPLLGRAAPTAVAKRKKPKPKKCKNGTIKCNKRCVNPRTNALHCGGCGHVCGSGNACVGGQCQGGCAAGQDLCGAGLCVDLDDNEAHCGECFHACQGELTCIDGQCGCTAGTKCGTECCGAGETCAGGDCISSACGAGMRDCGGGLCIPDDDEHCCSEADCPGQPQCNVTTHRCECMGVYADRGRCTGEDRIFCGPCCPGSDYGLGERCLGPNDERICVDASFEGCRCPDETPFICSAFNQVRCTFDSHRDPHACGPFCQECQGGTWCCNGPGSTPTQCWAGCPPGVGGGDCPFMPCQPDCQPCGAGRLCCQRGNHAECMEGDECPSL